ncbi:hypothetical protein [Botrimarina colliarenosi]|uniref:hypothetical protein n=1 Tax=Botrimarina colliarenosi TaxID=2528001 RepID=UPI0011B5E2F4|nr:hypothetical protein [Botrimarina colliarenosi]
MIEKPAIGHFWSAAIFSGFAVPSDWRSWADLQIGKCDVPECWLISLSLAASKDELLGPLREQMSCEETDYGFPIYIGDAKLGYIYWSYLFGRMSFTELLTRAGDEADGGTSDLECELVYEILNRLEERLASGDSWDDLRRQADKVFAPYLKVAQDQWSAIWVEESPSA